MKIVCDVCEAKYSVADSKVQGKNFKITCKKCGNKIVIKNKKEEKPKEEKPVDAFADAFGDSNFSDEAFDSEVSETDTLWNAAPSDMEFDEQATQIFNYADANNAKVQEEANWYIHIDGEQVGPITFNALRAKIKDGKLPGTTNVWQTGMADWVMAQDVGTLSDVIPAPVSIAKEDPISDPFSGGSDAVASGFGSESLFDESDAESLMGMNDNDSAFGDDNDSAFGNNSFGESNPNQGFDLQSLIGDYEDEDEEEEDDSSKSKVIDFRDLAGSNPNKRIVVQQANFNTNTGGGDNKKLFMIIGGVVALLAAVGIVFLMMGGEKKYTMLVNSNVQGATVKINGAAKGFSGVPINELKPGTYSVTVTKENYKPITKTIVIKKGNVAESFTLEANPVMITVKTGLADATVSVNGKTLGKTNEDGNAKFNVKPSANVLIKISKDGVDTEKSISVSYDAAKDFIITAKKPEEKVAKNDVEDTKEVKEDVKVAVKSNKKVTKKRTYRKPHKKTKKVAKKTTKKVDDDLDDLFGDSKKTTKKVNRNLPKTLKKSQVFGVLKKTIPKVRACGKKVGISGKVPVKFKINGTGSVSNIKVSTAAGGAKNCIYSKVRGMRFPKFSGKAIPVTFPFKL